MNPKRLLLINPVNRTRTGLTVNRSSRFPPLSLGLLAAVTPESWHVELLDENWEPFAYRDADLVGITAFTAAANRAYEIAALYRDRRIPVIMGGIHASINPEEALQCVDAVVVGEGERVWPRVIGDAETGQLQKIYRGGWEDLAGLARPRRDLFHPKYQFATVQTSRGCPMDCEFCSVTAFNGRRYRRRPPEDVLDELTAIPQKMIFFIDDNIIGYGKKARDEALHLFRGMVERRLHKSWFCQASINFADDEEVPYWAAKAGCRMVFLGLEAEHVDALTQVNKRLNIRHGVDAYAEAFHRIQRAGIAVLGAFIFGMDTDTPAALRRRTEYMIRSGLDVMQVTFLTPLPGTRLFQHLKEDGRLLYTQFPRDWDHYDMTEMIHLPRGAEPRDLVQTAAECTSRMYAWPTLLRKAACTLRATKSMSATMMAFQSNINYRNVALLPTSPC